MASWSSRPRLYSNAVLCAGDCAVSYIDAYHIFLIRVLAKAPNAVTWQNISVIQAKTDRQIMV